MNKLSAVCLSLCLLVLAGCCCNPDHKQMAMKDACSHCAGNQSMTSAGTCEACGMKVDVCAACPGNQTVTADGVCSGCGMKLSTR
jgi:hypothetical protein